MGRSAMAMKALLLCAMVVCAASFDCDTLAEPERTRCLDRAADMNIQMVPVDEDIIPSAHTAQEEPSYDEEDEDTDDIMGDLGEGAKTEAKASATAAAQEDLKLAQASTAGMYDDDVKVARAFSDLTDSMDDLKVHMGQLKMKTNVAKKVQEVKKEFAREEEERSRELGESDSTSVKKESFGILDATEADLDKDLTVDYHPDTKPNNDATVDDILGKMHADVQDKTPLDDATELIQYPVAHEDVDPAVTNDMVLQDLAGSESSLVERAEIEAKQSEQMDDEQELESQANDLGEAATTSEDAGDLDAVTSTLIDHPHLSLDTDETKKEEAAEVVEKDEGKKPGSLGDIGTLDQSNAVGEAAEFANDEDRNEEAIIEKAEQREQEMEKAAQKDMYEDEKAMKDLDARTNEDIVNANKVH